MVLEAFIKNFSVILSNVVEEEAIMVLGVKNEVKTLLQKIRRFQSLLADAEKNAERRKFDSSSIKLWLSQLKDVMYDTDDIIDLCRIEGHKLLAYQNPESNISPVCCNFSSYFSCLTSLPLHHKIGNEIKKINKRLKRIYKGREVDDAARRLVNYLVGENDDEKCFIFAITGMGGIGKTTIAQKVFNHPKIQTVFNLKLWACVSQNQSGIESLKQVISGVKGRSRDDSTKTELQVIVHNSIAAGNSLFLVLDNFVDGVCMG
ncbi:Putative disease resistance protein RGA3 [Dendrobium catenatum]|uniref:Disease resistance protein RGA3 n=1 Tax=Dendrobium catenatum TaxID=906689 RepID=A0A2I0X6Z9_9ASPA|nr:Putative disease resistance protein RGA3 [Dendrobium catenatum]